MGVGARVEMLTGQDGEGECAVTEHELDDGDRVPGLVEVFAEGKVHED